MRVAGRGLAVARMQPQGLKQCTLAAGNTRGACSSPGSSAPFAAAGANCPPWERVLGASSCCCTAGGTEVASSAAVPASCPRLWALHHGWGGLWGCSRVPVPHKYIMGVNPWGQPPHQLGRATRSASPTLPVLRSPSPLGARSRPLPCLFFLGGSHPGGCAAAGAQVSPPGPTSPRAAGDPCTVPGSFSPPGVSTQS